MTEYYMYIGDTVKSVGVWKREGDEEWPIYANTRGMSEWFSFDATVYENTTPHELSDDLVAFLAHIYRVNNGKTIAESDSMFWTDIVEEDRPEVDLEWYEIEFVNNLDKPRMTPEQEELLEWAYNKEANNE